MTNWIINIHLNLGILEAYRERERIVELVFEDITHKPAAIFCNKCKQSQRTKELKREAVCTVVGADGAALVVGDDGVGAVWCLLADDLIAHHRAAVAHADLAWFRFPHVTVSKHSAVQGTASARAWRGRQRGRWDTSTPPGDDLKKIIKAN